MIARSHQAEGDVYSTKGRTIWLLPVKKHEIPILLPNQCENLYSLRKEDPLTILVAHERTIVKALRLNA